MSKKIIVIAILLILVCSYTLGHYSIPIVNQPSGSSGIGYLPIWYIGDEWEFNSKSKVKKNKYATYVESESNTKKIVKKIQNVVVNNTQHDVYVLEFEGTSESKGLIAADDPDNPLGQEMRYESEGTSNGTVYIRRDTLADVWAYMESHGKMKLVNFPGQPTGTYDAWGQSWYNPPLNELDFPINVGETWQVLPDGKSSHVYTESTTRIKVSGIIDKKSTHTGLNIVRKESLCDKFETKNIAGKDLVCHHIVSKNVSGSTCGHGERWYSHDAKWYVKEDWYERKDKNWTTEYYHSIMKNFKVTPTLEVHLTSPKGGENWYSGKRYYITWESKGGVLPRKVKLEYSVDGPHGDYVEIVKDLNDNLKYEWLVPNKPSTNCYIRITINDSASQPPPVMPVMDNNTTPFTILAGLYSEIIKPNGGERLFIGESYDIKWSVSSGTPPYDIEMRLSTDNGATYPYLIGTTQQSQAGQNTFKWTVSNNPSTQCKIKLIVKDSLQNITEDESDSTFIIEVGKLDHVNVEPSLAVLEAGKSAQFTAKGYDKFNNEIPNVDFRWEYSPLILGSLSSNTGKSVKFTAGTSECDGNLYANGTCEGVTKCAYAQIKVTLVTPKVTEIRIIPATVSILVGYNVRFNAYAYNGTSIIPNAKIVWDIEPAKIGDISDGLFYPKSKGAGKIIAKSDSVSNYSTVDIGDKIDVTPSSCVMAIGETVKFTATGYDSKDNPIGNIEFVWTVENGIGSIDKYGKLLATKTGRGYVTARNGTIVGKSEVCVISAKIVKIGIQPDKIKLHVGEKYKFSAKGFDTNNNEIYGLIFEWSVEHDLGNVSPQFGENTIFTAEKVGEGKLFAKVGEITGYATITVLPPGATVKCVVRDTTDNPIENAFVLLSGEVKKSGNTDKNGIVTFSDIPVGRYTIKAEKSGYETNQMTIEVKEGSNEITITLTAKGKSGFGNIIFVSIFIALCIYSIVCEYKRRENS